MLAGVALFLASRPGTPPELAGLQRGVLRVAGNELTIVVAADHARGLMGIRDLGEIDGMLFAYPETVQPDEHRFWMQGVEIGLDIAFFDAAGVLVDDFAMPLCPAADQAARSCPLYTAAAPFRWALETETGRFRFEPGARLDQLP